MGRLDEQHNSISRGDSSGRDSLRLNNQVNIADEKAEVDVQNQASAFSISQQIIDDTLCRGSGFSQGKMRIYEQFEKNLSSKENAEFLKNEYGVGGGSHAGGHDGYSTWHDAKGLSITKGYDDKRPEVFLNWKQVATRIYQLIRMDRFLNPKEKEYYPKWLEEQAMKEAERLQQEKANEASKAEKLDTEYFYQYGVGDSVYIGASKYEIVSISGGQSTNKASKRIDKVQTNMGEIPIEDYREIMAGQYGFNSYDEMYDEGLRLGGGYDKEDDKAIDEGLVVLQDAHFPLVDKEVKREDFESLLKESIFNEHLKKPKTSYNRDLFIAYASNKLIDDQAVINAHKNSDFGNFKLEVNSAVDKIAVDLLVNPEDFSNLTVDEVIGVVSEFQNIVTIKEAIYNAVGTNIDIGLTQRESVTESDDIDFSDPFARDTDDESTAYDDIATEDTETAQTELLNNNGYTNYYRIYQLKDIPDYHGIRFQNSARNKQQGVKLNQDDYDLIYEGNWDELKDIPEEYRLERIFEKFNTDLPEDFRGHSLSVSDVITVGNEDTQTAYYVDSVGFTDFPEFFKEKEQELDIENELQQALDVSDTSEVQEQATNNTQSVEQDNTDLIGKELTLGNRRFRVEKISMFGDVSLRDLEFERVNGFPISRVEKVELVRYALEMEAEMKKTSTATKSVDELQIGDIIRLEGEEWRIDEIIGDFYFRIINQDENACCSRKAFIENWKERLIRLGYEYIPPVKESTRNIPTADKTNYIINDDNLGVGTKPERFQNNINAIRVLKAIESENRLATHEEQEILSKYVGWGGLDKYFEPTHSRYNELRECLTDDEFTSASASTLTAFYTPPVVIKAMYKALDNLGFTNGNILEPSCGTGNFMGLLPESMQSSKMYGVELDSISGRIAKQLYQKNKISIGGYEKEQLPDSFFDVAVGNVPFGDFKLSDKRYNKHKFLIHDYFYAKTLDKVRPGGVIAFITAKGTLDKKDNKVRKYIAERATLLGAIRLPNDTFKGAAGTEVTSDILFLQKKEALSLENPDWLYLKENEDGIVINQYFVDNPDMVMGDIKLISGPHGLEMACVSNDDGTLEEKLNAAVAKIQGQIVTYNKAQDADDVIESTEVTAIPADPTVKNYSYAIVDGDLYFRKNSIMEKQSITGLPEERVRGLIKLRDIVRDLIDYQSNDYPDSDISAKRDELNNEYEKFTKKYGLINSRGNKLAFNQDSSFPLLTSLELLDEDGKLKRKSDIFYKRTIKPYIPVTYAETSIEALAVSLNERGKVDIEYMAKLTGFEQEKV
ncbi:MAG: YodL domain-containing protein, partial [Acutalibacteraceae bacterium]|nr:YodL domain-containing protein [Acutalibacteraceae bacterium]